MEDNSKLFVFEKKEVLLIFVFIGLISVISFTLGVRTGKQLALKNENYTQEDVQNINLKSVDEEYVEKVVEDKSENSFEKSMDQNETGKEDKSDAMVSRLKEEMEKLANEKVNVDSKKKEEAVKENEMDTSDNHSSVKVENGSQEVMSEKYTIQVFSHQNRQIAEEFADSFIAKGYDVIINEVIIPGKGKWYRVGIGAFQSVNEAEDYLEKEKALFQDHKYLIQKM